MKYAFIQSHENEFDIRLMCQTLKVTRSSYYDWQSSLGTHRAEEDKTLGGKIKSTFIASRCTYGSRRIKHQLCYENTVISRRRISRLMKEQQLVCCDKKRFKATTNSNHSLPIAPHRLKRQFNLKQPNRVYCGDITYIATAEGWLYLAVVMDLFSRKVVGWSMKPSMKTELVNDALRMALCQRKIQTGLLWHTDQGSQYAAQEHRNLLNDFGIIQSMSRRGNCWDNAVAESFFRSLKVELVNDCFFKTRAEAQQAIFEYIEVFYNRIRLHSANGYLSPAEYERQLQAV